MDPNLPKHEGWLHHTCLGDIKSVCLCLNRYLTCWEPTEVQVTVRDLQWS